MIALGDSVSGMQVELRPNECIVQWVDRWYIYTPSDHWGCVSNQTGNFAADLPRQLV